MSSEYCVARFVRHCCFLARSCVAEEKTPSPSCTQSLEGPLDGGSKAREKTPAGTCCHLQIISTNLLKRRQWNEIFCAYCLLSDEEGMDGRRYSWAIVLFFPWEIFARRWNLIFDVPPITLHTEVLRWWNVQGSHSTWKTWKIRVHLENLEKSWNFFSLEKWEPLMWVTTPLLWTIEGVRTHFMFLGFLQVSF